jgi:hypothetical protein
MPFNNHSLDDLFRSKDKELTPGTHRMEAHWEQMQQLLQPAVPAKKPFNKPWALATMAIIAVAGTTLFFVFRGNKNTVAHNNAGTQTKNINTVAANTTQEVAVPVETPVSVGKPEPQKNTAIAINTTGKKEKAPFVPSSEKGKMLQGNDYIELPQEPQVFHITTDMDTAILCKHGTIIKIPARSLADQNGNTVTGEVTMIVQEYYRYEDVIAAGLNRNAEMKKKSITAGMVKFDAYREEQKLGVKPGCSIEISMRKDLINVTQGPSSNASAEENKIQELNIQNLGWISYERFYNDARPVTDIRVQVPKNIDINQLISQLAFVSVQGVMPGYIEKNQVVFYNIPVGEKAWFISLGTTGKKFLSCVEQIEIKGNDLVYPRFRETSPEQFKRQLEMLTALPVKER